MLTAALATYLAQHGHGTYGVPDATIQLEQLPDTGDGLMVAHAPAPAAEVAGWRRAGVQIVVRRTSGGRSRAGWETADAVRDTLNGLRHVVLAEGTSDETRLVWLLSDDEGPTSLGPDANGHIRWSLRFTALLPHETALTAGLA